MGEGLGGLDREESCVPVGPIKSLERDMMAQWRESNQVLGQRETERDIERVARVESGLGTERDRERH